jgi:hypothetical protein
MSIKGKRTKRELEAENAELRTRVKLLEDVVQRLTMAPPLAIPMPCPFPHAPPAQPPPWLVPVPNPLLPWPPAPYTICGGSNQEFASQYPDAIAYNGDGCAIVFDPTAQSAFVTGSQPH